MFVPSDDVVALISRDDTRGFCHRRRGEEFVQQGGQRLGGFLIYINDVEYLGLQTAKGLALTTPSLDEALLAAHRR